MQHTPANTPANTPVNTPANTNTSQTPPEATPEQIASAKRRILKAIDEENLDEAMKELMTHPSGRRMDYAESRMMYG